MASSKFGEVLLYILGKLLGIYLGAKTEDGLVSPMLPASHGFDSTYFPTKIQASGANKLWAFLAEGSSFRRSSRCG